eukprot:g64422.t1
MAIRWPHSESFQTKRFETNPTVEYWKCDHEWFPRKGNDYVVACSKCKETRVIDEPVKGHRKYGTFECICIFWTLFHVLATVLRCARKHLSQLSSQSP